MDVSAVDEMLVWYLKVSQLYILVEKLVDVTNKDVS